MASSKRIGLAVVIALAALAVRANAQSASRGFAFERLSPSAAGAGWFVMDDLDIEDALGGALGLTLGYERNPVHAGALDIVSDAAGANVGGAVTYARWRFSLDFDTVFLATGQSGTVDGETFTAPSVNPSSHPDTIADPRAGIDVLVLGRPGDPLRIGAGAQLSAPNDSRASYTTDGTFRGAVRALIAGDVGRFTYAGHFGAQIRPLDGAVTPATPRGNELLFGLAGGARVPLAWRHWTAVVGAEIYGATAFRSTFESDATALEGLLSARLEEPAGRGRRIRLKLGAGGGIAHEFGAAEWRIVAGVEIFSRSSDASTARAFVK